MANTDAWSSGWQKGTDVAQKNKNKGQGKGKQGGTGAPAGGTAGGGNPYSILSLLPKLHKGGKVKKTGPYRLRKGEIVLTAEQQKEHGLKKGKGKATGRKRMASKG